MKIGDHVFIGPECTISAIAISNHVHIAANVSIGAFVLVKEGSKILPGTIVPNNMVIPSGSIVGGRPARIVGQVGEGWGVGAGLGVGGGEGGEKWVEGGDLRELVRSIK
jgi:dynactin-5